VKFQYNTWQLKAFVNSVPEEVDLHMAAYIKDRTLGHGLQPMACEAGWSTLVDRAHPHPCDADVLKDFNHARQPRGTNIQHIGMPILWFSSGFPHSYVYLLA
jgi:hypothetical protein